jgi:glycerol kinase
MTNPAARYVLALDQGTTSSRAILFDHSGSIVAQAQSEFTQYFPNDGWVEHDAAQLWSSQLTTLREVLDTAKVKPGEISALGITNQRETTVVWDKTTSQPLARAIVWQDRRTADICSALKAQGREPMVRAKTGLLLDPYFSGTKLAWLLHHEEGVKQAAKAKRLAFGTIDSWLIWNLTQGTTHVTDASNASRTLLMNLQDAAWDSALLGLFGVPADCLPTIVPSTGKCAHVNEHIHPALAGVPISGIAGDQQAALFGQACFTPGMAKNTYGTGCFALLNAGTKPPTHHLNSKNGVLATMGWVDAKSKHYALEGSVFIAGAVVQWLRDGLGIIQHANEIEALAASVSSTEGLYFVPAFVGLGTPYWDANARGTLIGITRATTKAHIARAALEAIAFQSAELMQALAQDSGQVLTELRVDGGASNNNLLMQMQSDVLDLPVVRPRVAETTALGAAYLAGLATGFWKSPQDVSNNWQLDRRFTPALAPELAQTRLSEWKRAVGRSRDWVH